MALGRLDAVARLLPNAELMLYGFVRKEAVLSSQIEGTQATLIDLLSFEADAAEPATADVEEICWSVMGVHGMHAPSAVA